MCSGVASHEFTTSACHSWPRLRDHHRWQKSPHATPGLRAQSLEHPLIHALMVYLATRQALYDTPGPWPKIAGYGFQYRSVREWGSEVPAIAVLIVHAGRVRRGSASRPTPGTAPLFQGTAHPPQRGPYALYRRGTPTCLDFRQGARPMTANPIPQAARPCPKDRPIQ